MGVRFQSPYFLRSMERGWCVYSSWLLGEHSESRKPTRPYLTLGIVSQALTGRTAKRETLSSGLTLKDKPKESRRDIAFADPSPRFPTNHAPLSRHGTTSSPSTFRETASRDPSHVCADPQERRPHRFGGLRTPGVTELSRVTLKRLRRSADAETARIVSKTPEARRGRCSQPGA